MTRLFCFFFIINQVLFAQNKVDRIEPPNWWAGMKNISLQLMIHGSDIGYLLPTIDYPGIKIKQTIRVENPNYLFVDLVLDKAVQPGKFIIHFKHRNNIVESHSYELLQRATNGESFAGFDNSDVLYLITPDRFANGDLGNDSLGELKEKLDRKNKGGRHGGDIAGIRRHLDYIADLGFTAIWLNPLLENNMNQFSYHGYSTTDFYKVDPRFGSNKTYRQLSTEARKKGIKMIMDMIVNHIGSEHWWMRDMPTEDWLNQWETYTGTNHRKSLLQDPYASKLDKKIFTNGWFVPTMPDLNQRNELLGIYLIQNSIWWVEYLGLAGIRMDTYPYPDMDYMTKWTARIIEEYPHFNVVGEEWYGIPSIVAYWQKGKNNPNGYTSDLKSLMDFPLQIATVKALNEAESWGTGWITLYEMLAQDFLYADPYDLVVFPDNHDMMRFYSQIGEDFNKFKLGLAFILTTRGIPQIYYGTEILMTSDDDHGMIRTDFPGGWTGDKANAFTNEGLTDQQKEAKQFLKKLLSWRKGATAIHTGKLTHFVPEDGVYVYFRYEGEQKIMVILNKNLTSYQLDLSRFQEMLQGIQKGANILDGTVYELDQLLQLPANAPLILELE